MSTPTETASCAAHAAVLQAAHDCENQLAGLAETSAARPEDRDEATRLLTLMADQCRRAAQVFDRDPTLAGETHLHEVELLVELVSIVRKQLQRVLRAPQGTGKICRDGEAMRQIWAEAVAGAEATPQRAERVLALARPDYDTPAGQRAISAARLRPELRDGYADRLAELRSRLERALDVPHPHPTALALDDLLRQASELVAASTQEHDAEAAINADTLASEDKTAPAKPSAS